MTQDLHQLCHADTPERSFGGGRNPVLVTHISATCSFRLTQGKLFTKMSWEYQLYSWQWSKGESMSFWWYWRRWRGQPLFSDMRFPFDLLFTLYFSIMSKKAQGKAGHEVKCLQSRIGPERQENRTSPRLPYSTRLLMLPSWLPAHCNTQQPSLSPMHSYKALTTS